MAATAAAATTGLTYAVAVEPQLLALRTATVPVLSDGGPSHGRSHEPGSASGGGRSLRVLHISDLHMLPGAVAKQRWVASLRELEPDLVVNTGDNLAHTEAVPAVLRALDPLLELPGVFVFGSNDYYGPAPKNPARYLTAGGRRTRVHGPPLPWRDLRTALRERGWADVTHTMTSMQLAGTQVCVAGVDDPHLRRDRFAAIGGPPPAAAGLHLGLTHSPEPRVLDEFAEHGYDLVLAGHTHGGQLRVPGFGAVVTNCELDRSRARGLSRWGSRMWLHVSAGLGTSPWAPVRFACRPEASLLTLTARPAPTAAAARVAPARRSPWPGGDGLR